MLAAGAASRVIYQRGHAIRYDFFASAWPHANWRQPGGMMALSSTIADAIFARKRRRRDGVIFSMR